MGSDYRTNGRGGQLTTSRHHGGDERDEAVKRGRKRNEAREDTSDEEKMERNDMIYANVTAFVCESRSRGRYNTCRIKSRRGKDKPPRRGATGDRVVE